MRKVMEQFNNTNELNDIYMLIHGLSRRLTLFSENENINRGRYGRWKESKRKIGKL